MTGFTPQQRAAILARNGGLCEICGAARATDPHHRQPRGMGGAHRERAARVNALSNALALCRLCHNHVEHDRTTAEQNGWIVSRYADPATIPANLTTWMGAAPILLDDEGTYIPQ